MTDCKYRTHFIIGEDFAQLVSGKTSLILTEDWIKFLALHVDALIFKYSVIALKGRYHLEDLNPG